MKTKILRHVLHESEDRKENAQIVKTILEECSDYVPYTKEGTLYRGINGNHDSFLYQEYPSNRKPTHSTIILHDFLNDVFARKGFKTNRSNSIFCSGRSSDAATYGTVYVVFPKNGFNFLWSPKISDAYNNVDIFKETKLSKMISKTIESFNKKVDIPENYGKELNILHNILLWAVLHYNCRLISRSPIFYNDYATQYDIYSESTFTNDPKYYIYTSEKGQHTDENKVEYPSLYDVFPFIQTVENISGLPSADAIKKYISDFLKKNAIESHIHRNRVSMEIYKNLLLFFLNKFLPKSKTEDVDISPKEVDAGYRENDDLYAAMASGNEIMLSGSDGVYLIKNGSSLLDEVLDASAAAKGHKK